MALYLSLESNKFCFPAEVYNGENGHSGFMLLCYDVRICYRPTPSSEVSGTHRREGGERWKRIRSPPVSTPPYELHVLDCLNDLKPGDQIEIVWRKSKEFPYVLKAWWLGVVGHLESCSGSEDYCHCIYSDVVTLEFNHNPGDSRWRRKVVNQKNDQVTSFYGGIRKLNLVQEITKWKSLWLSRISD